MCDKFLNFFFSHFVWMSLIVKYNKSFNPVSYDSTALKLQCLIRITCLTRSKSFGFLSFVIFISNHFFIYFFKILLITFKYAAFGISTLQLLGFALCLFIAIILNFNTICQMHYIFCFAFVFFIFINFQFCFFNFL